MLESSRGSRQYQQTYSTAITLRYPLIPKQSELIVPASEASQIQVAEGRYGIWEERCDSLSYMRRVSREEETRFHPLAAAQRLSDGGDTVSRTEVSIVWLVDINHVNHVNHDVRFQISCLGTRRRRTSRFGLLRHQWSNNTRTQLFVNLEHSKMYDESGQTTTSCRVQALSAALGSVPCTSSSALPRCVDRLLCVLPCYLYTAVGQEPHNCSRRSG